MDNYPQYIPVHLGYGNIFSTWVQSSAPITLGKPEGDDELHENTSASRLFYIIGYCKFGAAV